MNELLAEVAERLYLFVFGLSFSLGAHGAIFVVRWHLNQCVLSWSI